MDQISPESKKAGGAAGSGRLPVLTQANYGPALRWLAERDPDLAAILERYGPPPLWQRPPGFPTLVHIILEQQVSLASAQAAFNRLLEVAPLLTPENLLGLDDSTLRRVGFSRQKTAYVRHLARAIHTGELDLAALEFLDDEAATAALVKIKGIGAWTAQIYLLMALGRPDIWPKGDLALVLAVQEVKSLPARPGPEELEALSRPWQPWRAVATRLFWHFYLSRRAGK